MFLFNLNIINIMSQLNTSDLLCKHYQIYIYNKNNYNNNIILH